MQRPPPFTPESIEQFIQHTLSDIRADSDFKNRVRDLVYYLADRLPIVDPASLAPHRWVAIDYAFVQAIREPVLEIRTLPVGVQVSDLLCVLPQESFELADYWLSNISMQDHLKKTALQFNDVSAQYSQQVHGDVSFEDLATARALYEAAKVQSVESELDLEETKTEILEWTDAQATRLANYVVYFHGEERVMYETFVRRMYPWQKVRHCILPLLVCNVRKMQDTAREHKRMSDMWQGELTNVVSLREEMIRRRREEREAERA